MKDTQLLHHQFPSPILKKNIKQVHVWLISVLSGRKVLEYPYVLLRIVSQWTLRMKQTQKLKPQTDAKIWPNLGKSNPKIWPSFKYINWSRIQRPCKKIQCAKKLIVAKFLGASQMHFTQNNHLNRINSWKRWLARPPMNNPDFSK